MKIFIKVIYIILFDFFLYFDYMEISNLLKIPEYFFNIQKFLEKKELNNIFGVSKTVYNNLVYTNINYQEDRKLWFQYEREYKIFRTILDPNIVYIKMKYHNTLYVIFYYANAGVSGIGIYNHQFYYFKHCHSKTFNNKEYKCKNYYDLIALTNDDVDKIIKYLFLCYDGNHNLFGLDTGLKKSFDYFVYTQTLDKKTKYDSENEKLLNEIKNREPVLTISNYIQE